VAVQVKTGDVFLIPLTEESWTYGQLVSAWNGELYVAIFDEKVEKDHADPKAIVGLKPVFLVLTLDAKLWHGHWPIIGNVQTNLSEFPRPVFKVRQKGIVHIESRDRAISRPATAEESEILRYRAVTSPAAIEKVVRAYFGIGDWNPHFDNYLAEYAHKSSQVL
jgi:Immunity protein 26